MNHTDELMGVIQDLRDAGASESWIAAVALAAGSQSPGELLAAWQRLGDDLGRLSGEVEVQVSE
jgi:hypothetical protein